ncbi:hypothetical protein CC80DRAFT_535867 [Byssothecium circinans]|uniref:Uncharacterized protein n=1 Tax=Byssothecium circinans TaxID=147558 RepID=A0A6A5TW04_9PLEO|nr:hypothetical protein CC80DRAFT_535867 [Byssothecium circinans]
MSPPTVPRISCIHGLTTHTTPGHVLHCRPHTRADAIILSDYLDTHYLPSLSSSLVPDGGARERYSYVGDQGVVKQCYVRFPNFLGEEDVVRGRLCEGEVESSSKRRRNMAQRERGAKIEEEEDGVSAYLNARLANTRSSLDLPSSSPTSISTSSISASSNTLSTALHRRLSGSTLAASSASNSIRSGKENESDVEHDKGVEVEDVVGVIEGSGLRPCGWLARDSLEVTREWECSGVLRRRRGVRSTGRRVWEGLVRRVVW